MLRLAPFCVLFLFLALLSLSSLPSSSAVLSQQLKGLLRSRLPTPSPSSAVPRMDCPIASNWTDDLSLYNGLTMTLLSGCLILAASTSRQSFGNVLLAYDVSHGTLLWSFPLFGNKSLLDWPDALFVSLTADRLYVHFLNFTRGCGEIYCDEVTAYELHGAKQPPVQLWSTLMGENDFVVQPIVVPTAKGSLEVLANFATEWVNLDGQSGRVLDRSSPHFGYMPYQLGDSHRLLSHDSDQSHNATAYELQVDGKWKTVGSVQWTYGEQLIPFTIPYVFTLPQMSTLPVFQAESAPDQLRAVDVLTGKTVWAVEGYDILTGKWVAGMDGFTARATSIALHPLNTSWAIVSAQAFNRSDWLVVQHALLDLTTGALVATSPITAPLNHSGMETEQFRWYQASGLIMTPVDGPQSSRFFIYRSQTMHELCDGPLPEQTLDPLHELATRVVGLDKDGVSMVYRTRQGQMVGRRFPATRRAATEEDDVITL